MRIPEWIPTRTRAAEVASAQADKGEEPEGVERPRLPEGDQASHPGSGSGPAPGPTSGGPLLPSRLASAVVRLMLGLCGLLMVAGFFMPWIQLGDLMVLSGLGLTTSGGQAIALVSGAHRVLPMAVPAIGGLLIGGALLGHPSVLWLAVASGCLVLGYGLFTLVNFFLRTTGAGVWLVVAAALISLGIGLLSIAARRAAGATLHRKE